MQVFFSQHGIWSGSLCLQSADCSFWDELQNVSKSFFSLNVAIFVVNKWNNLFWGHFKKWFQKTSCSGLKVSYILIKSCGRGFFIHGIWTGFVSLQFWMQNMLQNSLKIFWWHMWWIFNGKYQHRLKFSKNSNTAYTLILFLDFFFSMEFGLILYDCSFFNCLRCKTSKNKISCA